MLKLLYNYSEVLEALYMYGAKYDDNRFVHKQRDAFCIKLLNPVSITIHLKGVHFIAL